MADPLLQVQGVSKTFELGGALWARRWLQALDHVDLEIQRGQTLGIVGETGSGKSTVCRIVLGLVRPSAGRVIFDDQDITVLPAAQMRRVRRQMQAVFQDTSSAFNPRQTVREALLAPLEVHHVGSGEHRLDLAQEALQHVGLAVSFLDRHHTCSAADSVSGWPSPERLSYGRPWLWATSPPRRLPSQCRPGFSNCSW